MGRLRGKRNRDQDRYWHERRRSTQGGMVAESVLECIFCARLLASDEACFGNGGDVFCEKCRDERGIVQVLRTLGFDNIATLTSVDALSYEESVSGRSGRSTAKVVGYLPARLPGRRADQARERFERELRHEARRVARISAGIQFDIQRGIERELRHEARQEQRDRSKTLKQQREYIQHAADFKSRWQWLQFIVAREQIHPDTGEDASAPHRISQETTHFLACVRRDIEQAMGLQLNLERNKKKRKLPDAHVEEIRRRYASGATSFKRLGVEYGVTGGHITQIVDGNVYRDVGGPVRHPRNRSGNQSLHGLMERAGSVNAMA